MKFSDLSTSEGLVQLDAYLLDKSYVVGVEPTQADVEIFAQVSEKCVEKYDNVRRWFYQMKSYSTELKSLKGFENPNLPDPSSSSSSSVRKV